jgi:hypothetical protein
MPSTITKCQLNRRGKILTNIRAVYEVNVPEDRTWRAFPGLSEKHRRYAVRISCSVESIRCHAHVASRSEKS